MDARITFPFNFDHARLVHSRVVTRSQEHRQSPVVYSMTLQTSAMWTINNHAPAFNVYPLTAAVLRGCLTEYKSNLLQLGYADNHDSDAAELNIYQHGCLSKLPFNSSSASVY